MVACENWTAGVFSEYSDPEIFYFFVIFLFSTNLLYEIQELWYLKFHRHLWEER